MKDILDLLGRIFIACIFLAEGVDSILNYRSTQALMTEYGLLWRQDLLLTGGIVVLLLGGILILVGYRAAFGALLLLLYWAPVTFILYSFWNDPPEKRWETLVDFMLNLAVIGGLLLVMANGAGRFSVKRLFATFRVPGA